MEVRCGAAEGGAVWPGVASPRRRPPDKAAVLHDARYTIILLVLAGGACI